MESEDLNVDTAKQEGKRISKPLMEKRRRARINQSLSEMKNLLLDAIKPDNPRHSKLEKADILEMTVRHLQDFHRQRRTATLVNDPQLTNKFLVGFEECVREVELYLKKQDGVKEDTRQRLLQHLTKRVKNIKETENEESDSLSPLPRTYSATIQHCRSSCSDSTEYCCHVNKSPDTTASSNGYGERRSSNSSGCGCCSVGIAEFHLVPKRLSNGELALVLPQKITSAVNCLDKKLCSVSALGLTHSDSDSSTLHQDVPSAVSSSWHEADSTVLGPTHKHFSSETPSPMSSEASDVSSDESVGRPREPQQAHPSHPLDHSFLVSPGDHSPFPDNVWRPW
ncbi:protein hairy-like [Limulus polyphemus]|uniref:Protein hairy-like n=1 Tax=Limulus polyphemus TaxID=6850 RepID=A0ABM1BF14_LIMPO|nr:protein hairy-like [Limulus polyphemus]